MSISIWKQTCETCYKAVRRKGRVIGCQVLKSRKYPFERYGKCWAYTDDPAWQRKVAQAVERYKLHPAKESA